MSRKAVSGEVLVNFDHFEEVSLPSNPSRILLSTRC